MKLLYLIFIVFIFSYILGCFISLFIDNTNNINNNNDTDFNDLRGKIINFNNTYNKDKQWKSNDENTHRLCIIIPFRESHDLMNNGGGRYKNLREFKSYIFPFLHKQNIYDFTIFISEQEQGLLFNRAALFNAAFLITYEFCDYMIFHDVDMIPVNDENSYAYHSNPLHMRGPNVISDTYKDAVPGVFMMRNDHFLHISGFSNGYWGWGWEDNDIFWRLIHTGLQLERLDAEIGKYFSFHHTRTDYQSILDSEQSKISREYLEKVKQGQIDFKNDGIYTSNATLLQILQDDIYVKHYIFRLNNEFNLYN